jgi:hypothetical protein
MNATEEIVYVTLNGHRWMKAYEERENVWKDGCSCFWSGDDWYEHAAAEVVKALMPEKPVTFPGRQPRVHRDQERLFEVPDAGYKGIRL